MVKNTAYIILVVLLALQASFGCKRQPPQAYTAPPNTLSINGSVHEMDIFPTPAPDFPEHEGKTEFVSYCAICHTLRYISIQPDFSAKTWKTEVDKMVHKYGAPIDSVTCKKIADYLVAVKAKK